MGGDSDAPDSTTVNNNGWNETEWSDIEYFTDANNNTMVNLLSIFYLDYDGKGIFPSKFEYFSCLGILSNNWINYKLLLSFVEFGVSGDDTRGQHCYCPTIELVFQDTETLLEETENEA